MSNISMYMYVLMCTVRGKMSQESIKIHEGRLNVKENIYCTS